MTREFFLEPWKNYDTPGVVEPSDYRKFMPKKEPKKPKAKTLLVVGLNGNGQKVEADIRALYSRLGSEVNVEHMVDYEGARQFIHENRDIHGIVIDTTRNNKLHGLAYVAGQASRILGSRRAYVVFLGTQDHGKAASDGAQVAKSQKDLIKRIEMIETGKASSMSAPNTAGRKIYGANFNHDVGNTRAALER